MNVYMYVFISEESQMLWGVKNTFTDLADQKKTLQYSYSKDLNQLQLILL